jgi:peptidoglycan/xylan/chitin deacetylase (PgdA/CDA1 family)
MMVTLIFHHTTRGIADNAFPILQEAGAAATLAVLMLELPRIQVPPTEVSLPDRPGGLGNVQPLSLGEAGPDGLYTGRKVLETPGGFMDEDQIRMLADAGWELAFHGADHTPQSAIVEQVDGPGKMARAYAAGAAEIRRILDDPSYPVATNTLASNGWSPQARAVAEQHFAQTEVAWRSSFTHVPVAFNPAPDRHGEFNSIDFQRAHWDGQADLDEIDRLAAARGGGWLIIQLHDVVGRLEDSPNPEQAMLTGEFRALVSTLTTAGAHFVTFSGGAAQVAVESEGNRLRNTAFGNHPFKSRPSTSRLDWLADPGDSGSIAFGADGFIEMAAPDGPEQMSVSQWLSPRLLGESRHILRLTPDLSGVAAGTVAVSLRGPLGERAVALSPLEPEVCLELSMLDVAGPDAQEGEVTLRLHASGLQGRARIGNLSLEPLRPGLRGCGNSPRR